MKFIAAAALASAAVVSAAPANNGPPKVTDTQILNYALTLEHLENAFYHGALNQYDENAFEQAGFPAFVRGRFVEVAEHEANHVALLSAALGKNAVQPCTYKFPYTDPKSFSALAAILEGVGVSAYLGAAPLIQNKEYLTVAGAIVTTEARHQAWISSAANKVQPWSGPYDTPLDFDQVYSLAAPFIVKCPPSNPKLPVKAFPTLTATPANAASGTTVTYSFKWQKGKTYYAAFYHGLDVIVVKLNEHYQAQVPQGLQGTYYTIITTASKASQITDDNTVAGPLISIDNFPSNADNY